jgi:iron complex transport system substrate-binding protein
MEKLNGKKSLEGAVERITKIAAIFNKVEDGKRLVQTIKDDITKTQKPAKAPKVLFIYARGAGSMNVAGKNTSAAEMIKLAGGINAVQEYEGYKPINSEAIVAAAPDFILLTTRGLTSIGGKEAVSKLPGIALTPAGKQQKIISMDDLLLLGFGPRTGKAVAELAQAFQK